MLSDRKAETSSVPLLNEGQEYQAFPKKGRRAKKILLGVLICGFLAIGTQNFFSSDRNLLGLGDHLSTAAIYETL